MFWRFGFQSASAIDALLKKETGTNLEELFEEEELLQECKAHNPMLIEFLCRPNVISSLLTYIVTDDLDETKKFKWASSIYPYLACEVLSCEIYAVCEAAIASTDLMTEFWKFLDKAAPVNPLQASYFSKVNNVFFQKKAGEMVTFVRNQPDVVKKILNHIGTSAIADLLLKIISVEEVPEGQGIVQWLAGQNLIPSLIDRLEPSQDVDIHNTAAQTLLDIIAVSYQNLGGPIEMNGMIAGQSESLSGGNMLVDELKAAATMGKLVGFMLDKNAKNSTSTLTNGINIIIELIRRYCSEIEQCEYQQHQYHTQLQISRAGPPVPSDEKLCALATDLNDLLNVIGARLPEFAGLLTAPRNLTQTDSTIGKLTPLGSERLKTCELFAEVLHLQYLYTSSPLFERLIPKSQLALIAPSTIDPSNPTEASSEDAAAEAPKTEARAEETAEKSETHVQEESSGRDHITVSDELSIVTERFVESRILPMCLDLFFQYPWNNFLHSVVYDMIAKVFNTYSFTSTANLRPPVAEGEVYVPSPTVLAAEERLRKVKESVFKLVISILLDGKLTEKITAAQRLNDYEVEQPKGVRLGYMGHLTYISDEVCKLIDKCATDFDGQVKAMILSEEWQEYLSGVLRETKERDRQPLGGVRPTQQSTALNVPLVTGIGAFGNGASMDDSDMGVISSAPKVKTTGDADSDGSDEEIGGTIGGEAFAADGDVASDQFARYLCQQIVNDFPDKGILGMDGAVDIEEAEEVEGEGDWVSDLEVKDLENVMEADTSIIVTDTNAEGEAEGEDAEEEAESDSGEAAETKWPEKPITDETAASASTIATALDTVSDIGKALPDDNDSGKGSSAATGTTTPAEVADAPPASAAGP
ncbi:hypothetical protein HDU97_002605 [Phlyctochytrium planicorne]|nr:hypothetical protein HDU97_002605 [Phlyctochytrium planicorne]